MTSVLVSVLRTAGFRYGLSVILVLAGLTTTPAEMSAQDQSKPAYAIAIHGGAGGSPKSLTDSQRQARLASLEKALDRGVEILADGGKSLDAVEAVIRILEDDPQFNAGRGAVMNERGEFELDASIMDGRDRSCGAVAGVRTVKNPITLARRVMTETRHVLLATHGADAFAKSQNLPLVEQDYFRTKARQEAYERRKRKEQAAEAVDAKGTVGCVALDKHGNLAAGTSTGGLMFKRYGRVGDSPIVGAGTYADNASCAVSGTGVGEHFIRHAVAYDISARLRYGRQSLDEAVEQVIHKTLKPGHGGVIAVGADGSIAMQFNTEGMARAAADANGKRILALD